MSIKDSKGNLHSVENGQFIPKNGGDTSTPAEKKRAREILDEKPVEKKSKTQEEFFGTEHKGYTGIEAIEKLLQERNGYVKNAFSRPELSSGIDLVWGDSEGGLDHLIQRRDSYLLQGKGTITGEQMARKIPEIIDNGTSNFHKATGRLIIEHEGHRVVIAPEYHNNKVNWVLTGMEIW